MALCEICGEPMPEGETMFKYHGYSGPCPKPPLPKDGPFGEPTGESGESGIREAEKLTGVLRVGAVVFNPGVSLRVVQGAIDRLVGNRQGNALIGREILETILQLNGIGHSLTADLIGDVRRALGENPN